MLLKCLTTITLKNQLGNQGWDFFFKLFENFGNLVVLSNGPAKGSFLHLWEILEQRFCVEERFALEAQAPFQEIKRNQDSVIFVRCNEFYGLHTIF